MVLSPCASAKTLPSLFVCFVYFAGLLCHFLPTVRDMFVSWVVKRKGMGNLRRVGGVLRRARIGRVMQPSPCACTDRCRQRISGGYRLVRLSVSLKLHSAGRASETGGGLRTQSVLLQRNPQKIVHPTQRSRQTMGGVQSMPYPSIHPAQQFCIAR